MNTLTILSMTVLSAFMPLNRDYASTKFVDPIEISYENSVTYDEIHDEAIFNCPWSKQMTEKKEKIVSLLIKIEMEQNLPSNLRGMLVAAACHESGFEVNAKGDYRKGKPMALGLFQMWPWWEKAYKIDRKDPEQSAVAYIKHIKKMYAKVGRQCNSKTLTRKWLAAWATAIRAPKKGGRCNETPLFYKVVKKWHKNIKAARLENERRFKDGIDGC
tara:strand:- start:1001 stop:1648 length:648 start_codon:yes stop_codon:yes gene_type:complete